MNLFLVPRFVQLSVMATYHDLLVGYASLFNKKASVMGDHPHYETTRQIRSCPRGKCRIIRRRNTSAWGATHPLISLGWTHLLTSWDEPPKYVYTVCIYICYILSNIIYYDTILYYIILHYIMWYYIKNDQCVGCISSLPLTQAQVNRFAGDTAWVYLKIWGENHEPVDLRLT